MWRCLGKVQSKRDCHQTRLLALLFIMALCIHCSIRFFAQPGVPLLAGITGSARFQTLTVEDGVVLRRFISSAILPCLRWPDFADYQSEAKLLYEASGYALAWVKDGQPTPQAVALIDALRNADSKGLHAEDYDGSRWPDRLTRLRESKGSATQSNLVEFDLALTISAMRYISDLHHGRVNPRHFKFGFDVARRKYDLVEFLRQHILAAQDVQAALEQVEPPFEGYRRTIKALNTYRELAREGEAEPFPVPKKPLHPGDSYPELPRLGGYLQRLGDLPAGVIVSRTATQYQGPLVEAVERFQRRHGLDPEGKPGRDTFRHLNTPLRRRVMQLQLTLERWRWIPHEFPQPPIVVNIPEFRLRAFDERHKVALSMKVVVGKAYRHRTPVFTSEMKSVIFRPYWNVPLSIQRAEVVQNIEKDPDYLAKNNFEIFDVRSSAVRNVALSADILERLRSGVLAVRQKPGPENSLGLVKFVFPNQHDVYLHGTPATELFSKARRDFSHGCIRVEDPVGLAAWVLRYNPEWTLDRIRAAMNGDLQILVNLAQPIPVLILYGTAVIGEDGEVHFFDDIYGHDAALELVLAKGYPYPK